MIKKILTVLPIEDGPDYAELVRAWLAAVEDVEFILKWADSLVEGLNVVARGGVVLLDLGLPDSDGPATYTAARNCSRWRFEWCRKERRIISSKAPVAAPC